MAGFQMTLCAGLRQACFRFKDVCKHDMKASDIDIDRASCETGVTVDRL